MSVFPSHTLTYYHWDDIESYLCKKLDIKQSQFYNYHEVIGGEYLNLWHFWVWFVDGNLSNDSYGRAFLLNHDEPIPDYFKESAVKEFDERILGFLPTFQTLGKEIGMDIEEPIVVWYSW